MQADDAAADTRSSGHERVWESIGRLRSLRALAGRGEGDSEGAVQDLLVLLDDSIESAQARSAVAVAGAREEGHFDRLNAVKQELVNGSWQQRCSAAALLGRIGGRDVGAVVDLVGRLRDEHCAVRAAAATALATLHEGFERGGALLRLTLHGLVAVLDDAAVWVRVSARRALVACMVIAVRAGVLDLKLMETLFQCLGSGRPAVQEAAAEVLMCVDSDFDDCGGSALLRRWAVLLQREREWLRPARDLEQKEARRLAVMYKNRNVTQLEAVRRGNQYQVGEKAALTTRELKMRGECPVLFWSQEELGGKQWHLQSSNARSKTKVARVLDEMQDVVGVRAYLDRNMKVASVPGDVTCSSQMLAEGEESLLPHEHRHVNRQLARAERRAAIEALSCVTARGDERVLKRARMWLQDECWGVRCAAAVLIGRVGVIPLGSKWKEAGSERPSWGTEIKNESLAAALQSKQTFNTREVENFGVLDLSFASFIKAGNTYCVPVVGGKDSSLVHELCAVLAQDTDPSVRASAASALAALYDDSQGLPSYARESVGILLDAAGDEESWVRLAAHRALCTCVSGLAHAAETIGKNLADPRGWATASGVKWVASSTQPLYGQELVHAELARALMHKTEFTQQEWEKFGIKDLRMHHFVASGNTYFEPAATSISESCHYVFSTVARKLVSSQSAVREAAHAALAGEGGMDRYRLVYGERVGQILAEHARDPAAEKTSRAEACQKMLTYGVWTPDVLSAVEMHGYRLWSTAVTIRRSAAKALCVVAQDEEGRREEGLLIMMLSEGLEDVDSEVRLHALEGLQTVGNGAISDATSAIANLLLGDDDPENLVRGMKMLVESDSQKAQEVLGSLAKHMDIRVRDAAREGIELLKNDTQLILHEISKDVSWAGTLELLSRLTTLHARRGVRLLNGKMFRECCKGNSMDGDCVLAVLGHQLCLDCPLSVMRDAASFVDRKGVHVDDEETWTALEAVFDCHIELVDVFTSRTIRKAQAKEGTLVHMALLNGHALAISGFEVRRFRQMQTAQGAFDAAIVDSLSTLLGHENYFVRCAASRALGDISCAGNTVAIAALIISFSESRNAGLRSIIMSSICKICTTDNDNAIELMCSQLLLDSPDPEICVPVLLSVAELLLNEAHFPSTNRDALLQRCQYFAKNSVSDCDGRIERPLKWCISCLDTIETLQRPVFLAQNLASGNCTCKDERTAQDSDNKPQIRRTTDMARQEKRRSKIGLALAEMSNAAAARRFNGLGMLSDLFFCKVEYDRESRRLKKQKTVCVHDLDAGTVRSIVEALNDEHPRIRIRAMCLLRRLTKVSPGTVALFVDTLVDVIQRRDAETSTSAVIVLGKVVSRGTQSAQKVTQILLHQLSLQKMNYLGKAQRRSVWDMIAGFRQACLQSLLQIMPSGDSKVFVTRLALEDLDSPNQILRDAAFETLAGQMSDAVLYNVVIVKMVQMLKSINGEAAELRHFAVMGLQNICKPHDLQVLLALRETFEDNRQDVNTRTLAAQGMKYIVEAHSGDFRPSVDACINRVLDPSEEGSALWSETMSLDVPSGFFAATAGNMLLDATCSNSLILDKPEDVAHGYTIVSAVNGAEAHPIPLPFEGRLTPDMDHLMIGATKFACKQEEPFTETTLPPPTRVGSKPVSQATVRILHVPRSLSKSGRIMDEIRHIRRQPRRCTS